MGFYPTIPAMENEKIIKKTLNDSIAVIREYQCCQAQYNLALMRLDIHPVIIRLYLSNILREGIR